MTPIPTALTIAGSDSGGGAGIQADLKTFSALGVYGASAITGLTAQNTIGVLSVEPVSNAMIAAQIGAVLDDIPMGAIKIGMLGTAGIVETVAAALSGYGGPIVLDPVMVAKSGDPLLAEDAVAALIRELLPRAAILTPNLPEAARLLDRAPASSPDEAEVQARALLSMGPSAVLMKGGHGKGTVCTDLLVSKAGTTRLEAARIDTRNTHGTGCSLSSAIAAQLASGQELTEAVRHAHLWLHEAIAHADRLDIGSGHGPVHHFHEVWT
ncbi:MAG: bifunctional hydroxymethylpyrimidine kinase/phosphomethylpyrimidine kinase [Pseudomonadota bacterium]|uniref:bifunctional hydroxymethylpyrimidine kinase/phosphomethylpyrimidine kinase n=1 Tax=Roseovarius TaxID=74030 RepID=UPI0022A85128|nr:bifunctional hydroxymethylpyrimidine kinase/phosphomethylpyrimidine kinase [Roseovarius sp. EGI FJ00037]MCZ0813855.1 bifunctional hydroxymethylpyrimidine kinase/phosphomethylpyrimidine kinase [Roseovarius sp. EGI FJ00037]